MFCFCLLYECNYFTTSLIFYARQKANSSTAKCPYVAQTVSESNIGDVLQVCPFSPMGSPVFCYNQTLDTLEGVWSLPLAMGENAVKQ